MALDNSGSPTIIPIAQEPAAPAAPALSKQEQERQAFFKNNLADPLKNKQIREATQFGVPIIEGMNPRDSLQAIIEDPNVDIGSKEKLINNFSMASADKESRTIAAANEKEAALQPLFDKYTKAVELSQIQGFKPPPLPKLLQGTSFDPSVAKVGSPDEFVQPTRAPGNNPSDYMSPESNQLLNSYNKTIQQGNKLQSVVAEAQLASEKALQNYMQQSEAQELQFQKKQQDQALDLEQKMASVENARAEFASTKSDPSRFWNSTSTGQKIGIAIAAAFAGMGAAMQGQGGNSVLDILQNRIDADIDAQKTDMMNMKDNIASKESLYSKYYQMYKDDDAAYYATKAASLQQAQLMIEQQARNVNNQFTLVNAQKLNAELEAKKAEAYKAFQVTQRLGQLGKGGNQGVAQKLAVISALPDDQKKQANDELTKSMAHDAAINQAKRIFKDFETKTNRGERIFGAGDADEIGSELRSLLTQYVGISPKEIDNVVGPLVPGVKGVQDIKDKMKTVINILDSKKPATPILDAYDLSSSSKPDSFFSPRK